jgi:hypothetical protein
MPFERRRSLHVDPDLLRRALVASARAQAPTQRTDASVVPKGLLDGIAVPAAVCVFLVLASLRAPMSVWVTVAPLVFLGVAALRLSSLPARPPPVVCDRAIAQEVLGLDDDDMELVMIAFHLVMAHVDGTTRTMNDPIARAMHRVLVRGAHVSEHPLGGC